MPRIAVIDEGGVRLLGGARGASQALAGERSSARTAAVRAVRTLEAALASALEGQTLRGLKNLGHGSALFYAARVRGEPDSKLAWPAERDARAESLCILPSGQLVVVRCATDSRGMCLDPEARPALDDDFVAEDIEALARTLVVILPRHMAAAERARERYVKLSALASRIENVLADHDAERDG